MKLAVLITGSPRHVERTSQFWFKHKPNMDIDYYGHSWDEIDPTGLERYTKKIDINKDLFKCWPFKEFALTTHTFDIDLYDSARKEDTKLSRYLLWEKRRDIILSIDIAHQLMRNTKRIYDVVLVMRYDTIIKPGCLDKVIPSVIDLPNNQFHKGYDVALKVNGNNPNIFTPWIQIRQGLPVMQDYMLLARYDDWCNYADNLYDKYYDLLNKDKHFLDSANFVESIYWAHIFLSFIGLYSRTNFLTHTELGSVALRSDKINLNYNDIVEEHDDRFKTL